MKIFELQLSFGWLKFQRKCIFHSLHVGGLKLQQIEGQPQTLLGFQRGLRFLP